MRILIVGGNFSNKGAEAMLLTVAQELGARIPGASFFVGNKHIRFGDAKAASEHSLQPLAPQSHSRVGMATELIKEAVQRPGQVREVLGYRASLPQLAALCDRVDAAIDVSGYIFGDKAPASVKSALKTLKVCDMMRDRGKPFVFMPQMWGPFSGGALAEACRTTLPRASRFYARDDVSRRHLADLLGEPLQSIPLAPDIALLFGTGKQAQERGGERTSAVLGVAPNMRVYERAHGTGGDNDYVRTLTALIERFSQREGQEVVLIPHELRKDGSVQKDDRDLCEIVQQQVAPGTDVRIAEGTSAAEIKRAIGECELLLGSRFHSLVAALSLGVPVVAIGWAHKYPELLKLFEQEDLVVNYTELEQEALVDLVGRVWDERAKRAQQIRDYLVDVRARAAQCFDDVAEVLLAPTTASA